MCKSTHFVHPLSFSFQDINGGNPSSFAGNPKLKPNKTQTYIGCKCRR